VAWGTWLHFLPVGEATQSAWLHPRKQDLEYFNLSMEQPNMTSNVAFSNQLKIIVSFDRFLRQKEVKS
jgi:hypothetical protein